VPSMGGHLHSATQRAQAYGLPHHNAISPAAWAQHTCEQA